MEHLESSRLCISSLSSLIQFEEFSRNKQKNTHHGFVVERETLQLPQCVRSCSEFFKHHKRLASHLLCLQSHDLDDLAKLREQSVE